MDNSFIIAAKTKLRITTNKGQFSVEDLFDLSLKDLDIMAQGIDAAIEKSGGKSFLKNPDTRVSKEKATNELSLEILKTIINMKQEENEAKLAAADKKARLDFLKNLKEQKLLDKMGALSVEEIDAEIAAISKG
jgi:hypothetical protein